MRCVLHGLLALALLTGLAGCAGGEAEPAQPAAEASVLGAWVQDPTTFAGGLYRPPPGPLALRHLHLAEDGTFELAVVRAGETQSEATGTYTTEGSEVVLTTTHVDGKAHAEPKVSRLLREDDVLKARKQARGSRVLEVVFRRPGSAE